MKIDLRSDTVTKPTKEMLDTMLDAEVGDDVFGDDPTVNKLQDKVAKMFGMEAAIFCPSGTMTNQIAMRMHTQPQDEVICHKHSHVYLYEGGGMMSNSALSPMLLDGDRGRIKASQVEAAVNPDDIHRPNSKMVVLENTMNKGGGAVYDIEEIKKIRKVCDANDLKLHMDGARFFNAITETDESPKDYGKLFDSISICFSKGLGAPVGSVLLGTQKDIKRANRIRKAFGGGMRQAGYLAAACIYALDQHVDRLQEDHTRARQVGVLLNKLPLVSRVFPVDTNIVIAELSGITTDEFLSELERMDVHGVPFGPNLVRFVTHLDFTDDHLNFLSEVLPTGD